MDDKSIAGLELDKFSRFLPLPYRVAIIIVLGIWAWAANLHYLAILRIDVAGLIKYADRTSSNGSSYHIRTYRLATLVTIPLIVSLLFFWIVTRGRASFVLAWDILPQFYLCFLAILFILPLQRLSKAGRYRFLSTLKRISIGGIAEAQDGKFGDILLADVLTSYAKVLGDLFVSVCMFISSKYSSTAKPDRGCGGPFLVPLIISIPSLIRLRQCLIEYARVRKSYRLHGSAGSSGWGVIILSALQRGYKSIPTETSENGLFRLWLFFVFLNSFYSFYWDVAKDWDLTILSSFEERNNPEHAWGLRRHTHFHAKELYYGAIVIDLLLRCTWSLKLSPHLDHLNEMESGIFIMELLEVLRRWMWIFFRVETEWVRLNHGPALDDILLADRNSDSGKIDYD